MRFRPYLFFLTSFFFTDLLSPKKPKTNNNIPLSHSHVFHEESRPRPLSVPGTSESDIQEIIRTFIEASQVYETTDESHIMRTPIQRKVLRACFLEHLEYVKSASDYRIPGLYADISDNSSMIRLCGYEPGSKQFALRNALRIGFGMFDSIIKCVMAVNPDRYQTKSVYVLDTLKDLRILPACRSTLPGLLTGHLSFGLDLFYSMIKGSELGEEGASGPTRNVQQTFESYAQIIIDKLLMIYNTNPHELESWVTRDTEYPSWFLFRNRGSVLHLYFYRTKPQAVYSLVTSHLNNDLPLYMHYINKNALLARVYNTHTWLDFGTSNSRCTECTIYTVLEHHHIKHIKNGYVPEQDIHSGIRLPGLKLIRSKNIGLEAIFRELGRPTNSIRQVDHDQIPLHLIYPYYSINLSTLSRRKDPQIRFSISAISRSIVHLLPKVGRYTSFHDALHLLFMNTLSKLDGYPEILGIYSNWTRIDIASLDDLDKWIVKVGKDKWMVRDKDGCYIDRAFHRVFGVLHKIHTVPTITVFYQYLVRHEPRSINPILVDSDGVVIDVANVNADFDHIPEEGEGQYRSDLDAQSTNIPASPEQSSVYEASEQAAESQAYDHTPASSSHDAEAYGSQASFEPECETQLYKLLSTQPIGSHPVPENYRHINFQPTFPISLELAIPKEMSGQAMMLPVTSAPQPDLQFAGICMVQQIAPGCFIAWPVNGSS